MFHDPNLPVAIQRPARIHFEVHHLRRIPVTQTDEAHTLLIASGKQGRLFPLALSEMFAPLECVDHLELAAVLRSERFPLLTEGETDHMLLEVRAVHVCPSIAPIIWYIPFPAIEEVHTSSHKGFQAAREAQELVRLYPYRKEE